MNIDKPMGLPNPNSSSAERKMNNSDARGIGMTVKKNNRIDNKDRGFAFKFDAPPKPTKKDIEETKKKEENALREYNRFYQPPWWATILAKFQVIFFPFVTGMATGLGMITAALIVSTGKQWIFSGWPISSNSLESEDEDYYQGSVTDVNTQQDTPNSFDTFFIDNYGPVEDFDDSS